MAVSDEEALNLFKSFAVEFGLIVVEPIKMNIDTMSFHVWVAPTGGPKGAGKLLAIPRNPVDDCLEGNDQPRCNEVREHFRFASEDGGW